MNTNFEVFGPCGQLYAENTKSNELTREEMQSMISAFRKVLAGMEEDTQSLKNYAQHLWVKSSKDTYDGGIVFSELNSVRSTQRALKKRHNQLAEIQRKLKRKLNETL